MKASGTGIKGQAAAGRVGAAGTEIPTPSLGQNHSIAF